MTSNIQHGVNNNINVTLLLMLWRSKSYFH